MLTILKALFITMIYISFSFFQTCPVNLGKELLYRYGTIGPGAAATQCLYIDAVGNNEVNQPIHTDSEPDSLKLSRSSSVSSLIEHTAGE